ncbi:Actin cytoskeleton-regulatory complex protein pan1 [Frankliniella fusca]|uniref:Actin cytoskeleton-regulatory complex protein pan1 n=1 Tax=Frankliniella fusca TaxID=407009 RepID=A0AAE1HXW4_9NEOP|nr:Actin cytoskeleton-regulatory complex protein pan1 [Frankliniella fusca]
MNIHLKSDNIPSNTFPSNNPDENCHVSFLLPQAPALEEDQESRIKRLEAENLRLRLQLEKRPLLSDNINNVFTND